VRSFEIGKLPDTPHSLRLKAQEFARMAEAARDPAIAEELQLLADRYNARASEVEAAAAQATKRDEERRRS
jgi:hypothetical protein